MNKRISFILTILFSKFILAVDPTNIQKLNDISTTQKDFLTKVYLNNKNQNWWNPSMTTSQMINLLSTASSHGINPNKYLGPIKTLELKLANNEPLLPEEIEIRFTLSYFTLLYDMYKGVLGPEMFFDIGAKMAAKNLPQFFSQIEWAKKISIQKNLNIYDWVNLFSPKSEEYQTLKAILAKLRSIESQGGFVNVSLVQGKSIRPGLNNPVILNLRKRLFQQGYSISNVNSSDYDAEVLKAVTLFQKEAGLSADGVIGPKTQQAFNETVQKRIQQVEINLERFRWYPQDFGRRFIYVNIANQKMYVYDEDNISGTNLVPTNSGSNSAKVLSMNVIVGKPDRKTPLLVDRSSSVIFNPAWVVPPTVFREDVFPILSKNDLSILEKKRLSVMNDNDEIVQASQVDWSKYKKAEDVPYYFKQVPGYTGALGVLKFNLSNPYAIYLHDTGARTLFTEDVRYLSSGCVRLEKPVELATYILKNKMSQADIQSALLENDNVPAEKETEKRISYSAAWPVYITYVTASLESDGHMIFYSDNYQTDAKMAAYSNLSK